jgi:hypothetical protein
MVKSRHDNEEEARTAGAAPRDRRVHGLRAESEVSGRHADSVRVSELQGEVAGILSERQLLKLAGLTQRAALRRHLRKSCIPFKELNGRIFTTQAALDAAMVGREKNQKRGPNLDALASKSSG